MASAVKKSKKNRTKRKPFYIYSAAEISYIDFETIEKSSNKINDIKKTRVRNLSDSTNNVRTKNSSRKITIKPEAVNKNSETSIFYEYLTATYMNSDNKDSLDDSGPVTYEMFLDYIIAKNTYPGYYKRKEKAEEVPRIEDFKFDRKTIFLHKSPRSNTEVINYMYEMASYFLFIGDDDTARNYVDFMANLAPDDKKTRELKLYID